MDRNITVTVTGDVAIETLLHTFAPHWPRARTADYFTAITYPCGPGSVDAQVMLLDGVESALRALTPPAAVRVADGTGQ